MRASGQALQEAFPGLIWQRCQSHFRRNATGRTPSDYQDEMHQVLDQGLDQGLEASTQEEARTRLDDLRERLEEKALSGLQALEDGFYNATAVLALPEKYRKRLRTTNMLERPAGAVPSEDQAKRKGDSHLPEHRLRVQACRCPVSGDP